MANSIISEIQRTIGMNDSASIWMGLDVHKHSYHIALVSGESRPVTSSAPADPSSVVKTLHSNGIHLQGACFEAGPTGFKLASVLKSEDIPVIVAAPSKVPRSVSPGSKTDRLDCIKLAQFASKGLIRPIAIPTEQCEAERDLLRRRHQLLDSIRKTKQRIKALFLFHGMKEQDEVVHWSSKSIQALLATPFLVDDKNVLKSHIRELSFFLREKKLVETQIHEICSRADHCDVYDALRTVPGVGFVTASTFCLELFDPERFDRAEEVTSYLGLAPTVRHSGLKTPRGHLVPVGQKRLRSLLIEAAWVWIKRDAKAHEQYRKLLGKTGVPQKAIAAMARRLAIIMWRLSVEKRAYRLSNY
jgi:transposase